MPVTRIKNMPVVYKITSPSGKIYIGSTKNFHKRLASYKRLDCKSQNKLYNSFKKYGFEAHTIEVIEECSLDVLLERETFHGVVFDVLGTNGLNHQLPKTHQTYNIVSDAVRTKISKALKGRVFNEDWKRKISEKAQKRVGSLNSAYGSKRPDFALVGSRDKTGPLNPMYGKTHSDEVKEKLRNRLLGSQNYNLMKPVIDLETGIFYDSVKDCCKYFPIKYSTLVSRLNGDRPNTTQFRYA